MIDLILTMLVALEENDESSLGYSKANIDEFIKKYDIFKDDCNERANIILWQNKYISDEQFAKLMDIEYKDGKFWMVFNNFEDMLSSNYKFEANLLDGDLDWEPSFYSDYTSNEIQNYYWDEYSEKTLERIIKFCVDNELEIDDEILTYENTILKDEDIYFNDELLSDYLDELDELKSQLAISIGEAQDSANQDEYYSKIKNSFINSVGKYERKVVKDKKTGENTEKIYLDLSNLQFSDIADWLKEGYGDYEFVEETYGNLYYILREMEFFKFEKPDYDYMGQGDIDKVTLNEYTMNRLDWY